MNYILQLQKAHVLLIALLGAQASWAKPACVVREIIEAHRAESGTADFINLGEGRGVYPNPFAEAPKNQGDYNGPAVRTDAQIRDLVENVRATTIAEIAGGKPESQWTPHQKLMVTRVRNLGITVDSCEGTATNIGVGQVLQFCNMNRNLPLPALVGVIAHEIGHSVDLCSLSRPYFKLDISAPLELGLPDGKTTDEKSYIHDLKLRLAQARTLNGNYVIQRLGSPEVEQPIFDSWLRRGLMSRIDGGIDDAYNPARATFTCLGNQSRRFASQKLLTPQNRCQAGETGAQIWAARGLARYLKSHPESAMDMYGSMVSMAAVSLVKGDTLGEKENEFQSIFLSEPEVQKALGCAPQQGQNCMSFFDPSASSASNGASSLPVKSDANSNTAK